MEKFKLPDIWCCVANNAKEDKILTDYICENFGEMCDYDPSVNGNCWFANIKLGDYYYEFRDSPPDNCTEITFQQFKDYVLREKLTDNSDLEVIYLKLLQ